MNGRARGRWATPATLGALAIGLVYGRFLVQARRAVQVAESAHAHGDDAEATRAYLDALRAYVPGSPFERQALDGLDAIATTATRAHDWDAARAACQAVRAGLLGTRSMYVPYPADLRQATRRLAQMPTATLATPFGPEPVLGYPGGSPARRPLPSAAAVITGTFLSLGGFAMWVGAVVLLIRRGLEVVPQPPDRARPPQRRTGAASRVRFSLFEGVLLPTLFIMGFALFLLGMRLT